MRIGRRTVHSRETVSRSLHLAGQGEDGTDLLGRQEEDNTGWEEGQWEAYNCIAPQQSRTRPGVRRTESLLVERPSYGRSCKSMSRIVKAVWMRTQEEDRPVARTDSARHNRHRCDPKLLT